jgi:hypothetical protein
VPQQKAQCGEFTKFIERPGTSGSLTAAARKLARYKLDLLGIQEFRWDEGGTIRAEYCNFYYVKKRKIIKWEQDFLYTTK